MAELVKSLEQKNELSDYVFDDTGRMKPEVRRAMVAVAKEFEDFIDYKFPIEDLVLIGSLASYSHSPYSDADIHLMVDYDKLGIDQDVARELFDSKKNLFNNRFDIKIGPYDAEVYIQGTEDPNASTGVYSLLKDQWLMEPSMVDAEFDHKTVTDKAQMYHNLIEKADSIEEVDALKDKLRRFRRAGLDRQGEYSYENLTYKLLRRQGALEKLQDKETEFIEKGLSINEYKHKVKSLDSYIKHWTDFVSKMSKLTDKEIEFMEDYYDISRNASPEEILARAKRSRDNSIKGWKKDHEDYEKNAFITLNQLLSDIKEYNLSREDVEEIITNDSVEDKPFLSVVDDEFFYDKPFFDKKEDKLEHVYKNSNEIPLYIEGDTLYYYNDRDGKKGSVKLSS